ncbi:MAG: DegV family protein [Actinobacteria bacterium]|nr:DegV family protein [Actinomycetota bacterium]
MSPQRIGLCTDSNAQLPPALVERYEVVVVPITITIDDDEYLEGVDLDADAFYARFDGPSGTGERPTIGTSQPSPGQFALAYEELLDRGCTEILSIHVASSVSGTLNSARLAAHRLGVPVRLVDSATAGFGIGCCVWAAGDALAGGASIDEAASVAESIAPRLGNVFIVGSLDVLRAGGRIDMAEPACPIPVLEFRDGAVAVVARVDTVLEAVNTMASTVVGFGRGLRVAVGHGDRSTEAIADALESAVGETAVVDEVIRYRVGPSIGAHTGPGMVGCFVFPSTP